MTISNIAEKQHKITSFYSFAKLDSYNAYYNMAVGGRGIGKTYGRKKKSIADAIRRGHQFIYMRRYKEELQLAKETFFTDVQHNFPKHDFKTAGRMAYMSPISERDEKKRKWVVIGFFVALSQAQSYKSVDFSNVKTIIFDEFILEKAATHYLPNEAILFNNFYSTVDRYKGKTRVYFLANSVVIANPYFIYYKIDPDLADENGILKLNDFMVCHFIDSDEFEAQVFKTPFGKFIENSEYADYAVGNQFRDNHKSMIARKPSSAKYIFTLETTDGYYSVWHDIKSNVYFYQEGRPKTEKIFTLSHENMSEGKTLLISSDKVLQMLRTAYRHNRARFDLASTRNSCVEIFK